MASCQNDLYLWWIKMLTGATEKETGRVKLCSFSFTAWRTSPLHRIFCLTSLLLRGVLLFNCVFFVREYFLIILNMNGKVSKARCKQFFIRYEAFVRGQLLERRVISTAIIWNAVYYSINFSDY